MNRVKYEKIKNKRAFISIVTILMWIKISVLNAFLVIEKILNVFIIQS